MSRSVFAFDDVPFERRLVETIAWCAPRARAADPRLSLRSEALCPSILAPDRAAAVREVARSRATSAGQVPTLRGREALQDGRLLVYFPDADLADGAAEVASGGFFDVHNAPPWDTWVALAVDVNADVSYAVYVVAWVPPGLVPCAQEGIDVNPEECIAWLEDTDVAAYNELRHLLGR